MICAGCYRSLMRKEFPNVGTLQDQRICFRCHHVRQQKPGWNVRLLSFSLTAKLAYVIGQMEPRV